MSLEIIQNPQDFDQRFDQVVALHFEAFSGFPWYLSEDRTVVEQRFQTMSGNRGFSPFLALNTDELAGMTCFSEPTIEQRQGQPAAYWPFLESINQEHLFNHVLHINYSAVRPGYQGQGLASRMKNTLLKYIETNFPQGALVMTTHREDNLGIIKASEKAGFQRSGIRQPNEQDPTKIQEKWYKLINSAKRT